MRLYVLTRSAYGPAWSLDANRRRLEVTRAVTARLLAAQTDRDWTWVVLVDERDPLRAEREALVAASAPRSRVIPWSPPPAPLPAAWDRHGARTNTVQRIAAEAYRADWGIPHDEAVVQVRLDDDDGLIPTALARYREATRPRREVLMLPRGIRVWRGRYSVVRHECNAMHALVTPPGDTLSVYAYGHTNVARVAPVRMLSPELGWIWVRHGDTISGHRKADRGLTAGVRQMFPVDWKALDTLWRVSA